MSSDYEYRVKFKDIRIRPEKKGERTHKSGVRMCDIPNCDQPGVCKAPNIGHKPRKGEKIPEWLCQRHAAEFNKNWNFFDNLTASEEAAFKTAAAYGHKKTWRFGKGPVTGTKTSKMYDPSSWQGNEFLAQSRKSYQEGGNPSLHRTKLQIRALGEMDLPQNATADQVRERYADCVKRFHPDSNGGDRSSEDKLARVIKAYKTLKSSGLG